MLCIEQFISNLVKSICSNKYQDTAIFSKKDYITFLEDVRQGSKGRINNENVNTVVDAINLQLKTDLYSKPKMDIKEVSDILLQKEDTSKANKTTELKTLEDVKEADYNLRKKTFIEDYFGSSIASEYMLQLFTGDFVKNTLIDIADTTLTPVMDIYDLNRNLVDYQNKLYQNLKKYIEDNPNLHSIKMPENLVNEDGTNNFKAIYRQLEQVFGPEQNSPEYITRKYLSNNKNDKAEFQAIVDYFILKHFDQLILRDFKDFLNIGEIYYGKYTKYDKERLKYTFNTEHDYKNSVSWQTDERATPKDVMSNHLQYLMRTIPYIDAEGKQRGYLDTDVIIYNLKALKDIYLKKNLKNDTPISSVTGLQRDCKTYDGKIIKYSNEELDWIKSLGDNVYLSNIINRLRDNPQLGYSVLFKVIRSDHFVYDNKGVFNQEIVNIMNSLYQYVFDNDRLFKASPQLYQELMHFFDFTTNLENTQFFMDNKGEWSIRTMNPMNIETNKAILQNSINSAHLAGQIEDLLTKYNVQYEANSRDNSEKYVQMQFTKRDLTYRDNEVTYTIRYYPANSGEDKIKVFKSYNGSELIPLDFSVESRDDYENFKGFVKDALAIDLNANPELDLQLRKSENESYSGTLQKLLRISASVLGNTFIFKRDGNLKKTTLDKYARRWGIWRGDDKDVTFNYKYAQYDVIGNSESHLITWLATNQGIARRQMAKSTTRTAEKTTISANSLTNFSAERQNQYEHLNEDSAVRRELLADILGWGNTREVDLGITGKQAHNLNFNELLHSSFCVNFLTGYKNANGQRVSRFTEAVNSDKGNSPVIEVPYENLFNSYGIPFAAETFYGLSEDANVEIPQGHKNTFAQIYKKAWDNMQDDFKKLRAFLFDGAKRYKQLGLDKDFQIDAYNNFEKFNEAAHKLGLKGNDLLHKITLEYNNFHFNDPIAIIENVHKRGSGDIELNRAFITNLMRFNSTNGELDESISNLKKLKEKYKSQDSTNYWDQQQDLENYFKQNEVRLVDDLLTEGARINIGTDEDAKIGWRRILNSYEGWKDANNDMVFAKIRVKNKFSGVESDIDVNDYTDLIGFTQPTKDGIITSENPSFDLNGVLRHELYDVIRIDVHPALRAWTAADGLYTGKSQTANVGLTVYSDPKGSRNSLYEEEGAVGDFVKRNVINTATMKQFTLNSLVGITEDLKIAAIEDIRAQLTNIVTDYDKYKVWDGATFTNAFQHYWENNSLSGSITGFTKKPIMHYYFDKYAAGYLQKTASFAINNEKMRDSVLFRAMHYKTSNMKWRDENNSPIGAKTQYDITRTFDNKKILYDDCFYKSGGRYYRIKDIEKVNYYKDKKNNKIETKDNNFYRVLVEEVKENGQLDRENVQPEKELFYSINSNYALWQALGGYNSVSYNRETGKLEFSEKSIEKVAEVANKVGVLRETKDSTENNIVRFNNSDVLTQHSLYQFMKHSNIHYITTEGAVKKGVANVNKYNDKENCLLDSNPLNFFKVSARNFGIQLDPTHQADDAEVSLMTQVISGLADRGYTSDAVNEVYMALGRLAREAVAEDLESYRKTLGRSKDLESRIAQEIASSFINELGNTNGLVENIAKKIANMKYEESKAGIFPWSDPSIFKLISSQVTSTLNKMAIRVKSFGSLSVLNPSHGTIQLYNNKKLSEFSSAKTLYEEEIRLNEGSEYITNHKLYLGHWYTYKQKDGQRKRVRMDLDKYYELTSELDKGNIKWFKEVFLGDEIEINDEDRNKAQFGLFKLYTNEGDTEPLITYIDGSLRDPSKQLTLDPKKYYKVVKVELLGRDLDTYNVFINDGENTLYDLKPVKERYDLRKRLEKKEIDKDTYKKESHRLLRDIQREINNIKEEAEGSEKHGVEFTDGIKQINNYETSAYGIFVPMIYKSKFGLRPNDNLSDIVNDEEFFFKRLLQNYADLNLTNKRVSRENYDVVIKNLNNENIYLQTKQSNLENNNEHLQEIQADIRQAANGKFYRYDLQGNKLYEVSSQLDKIFVDNSSENKGEVIVTDDAGISFYINKFARDAYDIQINKKNVSKEKEDAFEKRINSILEKTNLYKKLEGSKRQLTYENLSADDSGFINNYLQNGMEKSGMGDAIYNNYRFKSLWEKSQKIRVSFLESLKFLAARIPAQSMQSFMTMKVEGFTNIGVNDCYISDMQVWLQGSDFDVDKVTLMGLSFTRSGQLKTWSKYIRYQTEKEYEITSKIKFPTGLKTKVVDSNSTQHHKYESLFKNGKLSIERPESPKFKTFKNPDGTINPQEEQKAYAQYKLDVEEYHNKLQLMVEMFNEYSNTLEGVKDNLRDNIQEAVDDNNLQEIRDIDEVLMNLVQKRATEISEDIVNIIPGQNPIDVVAGPLKDRADQSNFGKKDIYNRYGNAVVKLKQLLTNQTGKMGISVTAASGIKTFFALTQYFNNSLKHNLSVDLLDKLRFNVEIRGKKYHTISNLNEIRITDKIKKDKELLQAVTEFNEYIRESDIVDADAVISAIMTLATDNAKELKLGKLNASAEILGLYLYGVTIGVPFDTLADIFTSNTADVLNKRMNGNVFTDESDTQLSTAINWLNKGPTQPSIRVGDKYVPKGEIASFLSTKYWGKDSNVREKSIVKIVEKLKKNIASDIEINSDDSAYRIKTKTEERGRIFKNQIKNLIDEARRIESDDWEVKQYKTEVIEYLRAMHKIYGDGNFERNDLKDIKQLLNGSKEIGTLRSLILNKGVPVLLEDKLSFYDNFSTIIQNALPAKLDLNKLNPTLRRLYKANNNSFKIDIEKYCTNDKYKNLVIDAYQELKHTINPFMVVEGLPHFKEYLNVAAADSIRLSLSSVFRAIRDNSNFIFDTYGVYGGKDVRRKYYKRMEDFFVSKLQDKFLQTINIRLDSGILVKDGNTYNKVENNPVITLGTSEGNTAFKNWVETKLLNDLQEGVKYSVKNNTFVRDLMPKLYTKTMSGNRIKALSLPYDLIPKTELEQKTVDKYQLDYMDLTGQTLITDTRYSIADVLYLYNLITYGNSRNIIALTSITDSLYSHPGTVATKYSDFIAKFDSNNTIHITENYRRVNAKPGDLIILQDDLLRQVAPESYEIKNKKKYRGPYVRLLETDTGLRQLWKLKDSVIKRDQAEQEELAKNSKGSSSEEIDVLDNTGYDYADEYREEFGSDFADSEADMTPQEDLDNDYGDVWEDNSIGEDADSEDTKKDKIPKRDFILGRNYERMTKRGQTIDKTALDVLGKFVFNRYNRVEEIPDLNSNNFSAYLENKLTEQVQSNEVDNVVTLSIDYFNNGKLESVDATITRTDKKFKIAFKDGKTAFIDPIAATSTSSWVFETLDYIMLKKRISDNIKEKHNIKC